MWRVASYTSGGQLGQIRLQTPTIMVASAPGSRNNWELVEENTINALASIDSLAAELSIELILGKAMLY